MEKIDIKDIENIERIELDPVIVEAIENLQVPETNSFYDGLLRLCQRMAIEKPDLFEDDEALEIIRGFHMLRQDLRLLLPPDNVGDLPDIAIPSPKCFADKGED